MAEKLTIKKVYRDIKQTKRGPATMTTIYVKEYPQVRLSSFDKGTDEWKEGDVVNVEVTKNGEFTNFKVLTQSRPVSSGDLELRVKKLEEAVFGGDRLDKDFADSTQEQFDDF